MIVLGIDPGTAALGWGIIERSGGNLRLLDAGCFETSAELGLPDRLLAIHRFLGQLIARHDPAVVAVERLFFSRNAQTAFAVGQARGVVLLAAAESGRAVREATPNEVKMAVTGSGSADKTQVGRMVAVCLGLSEPPRPDDAADALAVAIWAANSERSDGPSAAGAPVLDRASVDPMVQGETSYARAVREALVRDRAGAARSRKTATRS
ncbi:MAG TPA: crossover junction endodeoxyribonuclease RuvC [Candidatus Sulfomarinibacteraceae bacterium]|nr:crossover junction endodeoxyribonuclease RuvC [Candidatus Sulfomarinibacteraceae bacterium]